MAFFANGDLIEVDDGGIYRRSAPRVNTGDWFSLIGNLQVTELHDIVFDHVSHTLIGGAQDTGAPFQSATANTSWFDQRQGDGGDVAIDYLAFPGNSLRYYSGEELSGPTRCQFSAANALVGACSGLALAPVGADPGATFSGATFDALMVTNPFVANRLLIGADNGIYESSDAGATVSQLRNSAGIAAPGVPRSIVAGHVNDSQLLYVASGGSLRVRTTAAPTLNPTAAQPAGGVVDVDIDAVAVARVYTISTTSVATSANTGATWTNITGDLLALRPGTLRTIKVIAGTPTRIFVGADRGVFHTVAGSTSWREVDATRLPNALVFDMDYDAGTDTLYVGTMGRGAWSITGVSRLVVPVNLLNISGRAAPTVLPLVATFGLTGAFTSPFPLDLRNVRVTAQQLLFDGTRELVSNVPLSLNTTPPLATNVAFLSSLIPAPVVTMELANNVPFLDTLLEFDMTLGTVALPTSCPLSLGTASLRTSFLIDDGIHPPIDVNGTDVWTCLPGVLVD